MLNLLVYLLIVGVVIGAIWWIVDYMPVPEPLNRIIKVVSIVVGVIVIVYVLLALAGTGGSLPVLK